MGKSVACQNTPTIQMFALPCHATDVDISQTEWIFFSIVF